jgi:hypothetical protein
VHQSLKRLKLAWPRRPFNFQKTKLSLYVIWTVGGKNVTEYRGNQYDWKTLGSCATNRGWYQPSLASPGESEILANFLLGWKSEGGQAAANTLHNTCFRNSKILPGSKLLSGRKRTKGQKTPLPQFECNYHFGFILVYFLLVRSRLWLSLCVGEIKAILYCPYNVWLFSWIHLSFCIASKAQGKACIRIGFISQKKRALSSFVPTFPPEKPLIRTLVSAWPP